MNQHFASLVMGLAAQAESALQGNLPPGMEKLPPAEVRRIAQSMIDTLGMLETKSAGNLDPDEQRLLTEALTALRFRFVQTGGPTT
ncbi:MAG: DUF1844 domain-containing protein [Gemmatimonadota bacterium]|nr:DUF1844 domain-containing protein [Gemmatimonadota bacterium]